MGAVESSSSSEETIESSSEETSHIISTTPSTYDEIIVSLFKKEITGAEFNQLFPTRKFVKFTNEFEYQYNDYSGIQFKDGLNIDTLKIDPHGLSNGISFNEIENAWLWLSYDNRYIRDVIIPDDARVFSDRHNLFIVDKIYLGPRRDIDLMMWIDRLHNDIVAGGSGKCLWYVPTFYKTRDLYLELVNKKGKGYILRHIPPQMRDREICMAAVKSGYVNFEAIPSEVLDKEICIEAVKQKQNYFTFPLNQIPSEFKDKDVYMAAVCTDGSALTYVPIELRDKDLCLAAIHQCVQKKGYVSLELCQLEVYTEIINNEDPNKVTIKVGKEPLSKAYRY